MLRARCDIDLHFSFSLRSCFQGHFTLTIRKANLPENAWIWREREWKKSVVNTIIALSHINTNVISNIYVCLYINSVRVNMCVCVLIWKEEMTVKTVVQFSPYEYGKHFPWCWKYASKMNLLLFLTHIINVILMTYNVPVLHFPGSIMLCCVGFCRRVCRLFFSACAQWQFGHWISCLIEITSIRIKRVHGMNLRAIALHFCLVSPHFECQVYVVFCMSVEML